MKRVIVALNPPRRVHDFCAFARSVSVHLAHDPLFSPPSAPLDALDASVRALEASLVAVESRRRGAASERKASQSDVLAALQTLRAYVQSVADALPANEAAVVAARAGMFVKDARGPKRGGLTVKQGRTSGTARAYAPVATTRAGYEWQYAHEGEPWISLPFTVHADAELEGLVPGASYSLRARSITAEGPSDWLQPVTFRVT